MDEGNQVFPQGDSAALLVIEFPSFRDFIDAYSPIISEEGIFIRNADVSESNAFTVGDRVDFEVRLKDDFRLIQGAGEVVWLGQSEAAQGAAGTAIRFHDVDEPSQRLISRLVGNFVRDGGKLFEIGAATGGAPSVTGAEVASVADTEQPSSEEPEGLVATEAPRVGPELTAENLGASEADELFAGEDEERSAPLEFESVALADVEPGAGAESPRVGPQDPVGLDTIAIPSGLLANLASEEKAAAGVEAVEAEVEGGLDADDSVLDSERALLPPDEFDSVEDRPIDVEGSFSEMAAESGKLEPLEEDLDRAALEAAGVSLDGRLGGGGIPDDIAQVAEELSGVHRFEPPESDEISGIDYAGSASARPERNTGGRIAAISVVFVLLGAAAFYFGDSILSTLGWGGDVSAPATDQLVRAGETMPSAAAPNAGDPIGLGASTAEPVSEEATEQEAIGVGGEGEPQKTLEDTSTLEPVSATVDRASDQPVADEDAEIGAARDRGAQVGNGPRPDAAAAADAPAAVADRSRRVERMTWREEGGETILTIRLNAEISKALVDVVRVRDGAPREVIKIQGVDVPYSPREVAVGSRHVVRLRTGLHRNESGSALHVVADLTGAGVTILSVEPKGRDILITFS